MCRITTPSSPERNGTVTNGNGYIKNNNNNKKQQSTSSSALRRMTPFILLGYTFNTILYFAVEYMLPSNLIPDPKYCPNNDNNNSDIGCDRRDLFAFQVVSFVNLSYLGLLGFYTFYITKRASIALPQTPQGRYFGNCVNIEGSLLLPEADYINAVIVIFQGWDFVASLFFEEHCTPIMMTHHALAFICGFFCLVYEVNPYYAVYFGGVSEFSSIFLCISQLFQYYPPSSLASDPSTSLSSIMHSLESISQAMFVLTFFIFRIIGWAYYSYMFISDGLYVLKHDLLKRFSPGSGWFLLYLLSMAVLLGGLQLYWLGGIVDKLRDIHG